MILIKWNNFLIMIFSQIMIALSDSIILLIVLKTNRLCQNKLIKLIYKKVKRRA